MDSRKRRIAIVTIAAIVVAGCASSRTTPEPLLPPPPRGSDAVAYRPAKLSLAPAVDTAWHVHGEDVDVTMLLPAERGPFPLVVYLPGLGEGAGAGLAWRRAWAEAGYAVLSVQTRALGTGVWSAERARSFDFRSVALEHFAPRAVPARIALIGGIVDEIGRRQRAAADAIEHRIDANRIAIAGYDVGALTAMAIAGQSLGGTGDEARRTSMPSGIRGVIALSPYADFGGLGTEARFRDIRLPVLSVTSPEDTDAYGLVTTAAVRRAPFQYMPPGRKYLLLLGAGPHSLLGGADRPPAERDAFGGGRREPRIGDDRGTARDGRQARARGDAPATSIGAPIAVRPDLGAMWATQLRNVQVVSIAYLDALLYDSVRAREWLERDAARWLDTSATLTAK